MEETLLGLDLTLCALAYVRNTPQGLSSVWHGEERDPVSGKVGNEVAD